MGPDPRSQTVPHEGCTASLIVLFRVHSRLVSFHFYLFETPLLEAALGQITANNKQIIGVQCLLKSDSNHAAPGSNMIYIIEGYGGRCKFYNIE